MKDNVDKGLFLIAMANKYVKPLRDLYLEEIKRKSSLMFNIAVAIELSYASTVATDYPSLAITG